MNTSGLAVRILFVVLAVTPSSLSKAKDPESPDEMPVYQADPPARRIFLSPFNEEEALGELDDSPLPWGPNNSAPFNESAPFSPEDGLFEAQSITQSPEACAEECSRSFCCNPCPCFYGQIDALFFMGNPRFARQAIVVDPNTNTTYMSNSNLAPNYYAGVMATFGMRVCGGRALEFQYFGLFGGNTSAVAVAPNESAFLAFPGNLAGNAFVDMDRLQANYSSALQSFAINFPCCCGCQTCDECGTGDVGCQSITWFGGFRYLNLNDRLNLLAQRTVAGGVEQGSYNIRTYNRLYGPQLGARVRRTQNRFGWEATGTGGIFGNDARQTQQVTDFPNYPLRPTVSSNRGGVAFVGVANLSALYLLTNVWNLRLGYSVIWIEGLALSPNQLDYNLAAAQGGSQLRNGGGLLLHGVNIGLEARW